MSAIDLSAHLRLIRSNEKVGEQGGARRGGRNLGPNGTIASWTRQHPVISSVALVAFSAGAALLVALLLEGKSREALQGAAVGLVFVGLIGGLVKLLLEDFQRNRESRADQLDFVSAMLADLKAVYDQVERARIVIRAHRSAKTYGDEMRGLIDARIQLRNVGRTLEGGTSGLDPDREEQICSAVRRMEEYLEVLTDEFHRTYKEISDEQRIHEARIKKLLDNVGDSTSLPPNRPWDVIKELEGLSDFIKGDGYGERFTRPLDDACAALRAESQRLFSPNLR